jgi:UDP-glucuronate 4-epimerase
MSSNHWNVLVTGAAGFIGFHVANKLKENGHSVIGLDNFCPYYTVQLKKDRAKVLEKAGVRCVEANVEDASNLKRLIEQEKITHIVHLAAQAGVRYSLQAPEAYLQSNIDGFLSVLEAVRANPSIVTSWASSSSVYGTNTKLPFSEADATDSPANLYGATKKANEVMAHAYHHLFGMKLIGLRFFTVYGPWGRPDMAYFLFADKMMRGEPIDLFGGGMLRRDFTYIDDIVDGIISSLSCKQQYGVYNLGNCHSHSVQHLVECLEASLHCKAKVRHIEVPAGDMSETWADIRKAQEDFGYNPKVSLSEGIDRFAKWYRSYTIYQK